MGLGLGLGLGPELCSIDQSNDSRNGRDFRRTSLPDYNFDHNHRGNIGQRQPVGKV